MEKLLIKVYDEFKMFYKYKTKNIPSNYGDDLKIQKEETVTKPKTVEATGIDPNPI
jgi:hypothetical protein